MKPDEYFRMMYPYIGQAKALTQGKGYYSILNTIVVMAFRKFMLENAVYNPGLCIVDTPLHGIDEGTKNETSESVQTALFSILYQ